MPAGITFSRAIVSFAVALVLIVLYHSGRLNHDNRCKNMRYELKSIPLWPVTRVAFFVNLVVGFVVGIMYAVFLIPFVAMMSNIAALESGEFDMQAAPVGVLMMIVPFFSALSSAFFGNLFIVIIVLAYNLITRMTGGIELNLQQLDQQAAAPAPARGDR